MVHAVLPAAGGAQAVAGARRRRRAPGSLVAGVHAGCGSACITAVSVSLSRWQSTAPVSRPHSAHPASCPTPSRTTGAHRCRRRPLTSCSVNIGVWLLWRVLSLWALLFVVRNAAQLLLRGNWVALATVTAGLDTAGQLPPPIRPQARLRCSSCSAQCWPESRTSITSSDRPLQRHGAAACTAPSPDRSSAVFEVPREPGSHAPLLAVTGEVRELLVVVRALMSRSATAASSPRSSRPTAGPRTVATQCGASQQGILCTRSFRKPSTRRSSPGCSAVAARTVLRSRQNPPAPPQCLRRG